MAIYILMALEILNLQFTSNSNHQGNSRFNRYKASNTNHFRRTQSWWSSSYSSIWINQFWTTTSSHCHSSTVGHWTVDPGSTSSRTGHLWCILFGGISKTMGRNWRTICYYDHFTTDLWGLLILLLLLILISFANHAIMLSKNQFFKNSDILHWVNLP